ncbi:MAG: substrate-binding domain-containing protein [Thermodesulfobacteriota bacterium]
MSGRVCSIGISALVMTLLSGLAFGGDDIGAKVLRAAGSDNVGRFVNVYARDYMAAHPGTTIAVVGGKTRTGIEQLLQGNVELAMASRRMTPSENKMAQEAGLSIVEQQIGWCSTVIIVHPANPVSQLDKNQLVKVFKGEYTNWNEVGGPNRPIMVLASDHEDSDACAFFKESVMGGSPYASNPATSWSMQRIVGEVLKHEGAISLCRVTDLEYREQRKGLSAHGASHESAHSAGPAIIPKILAVRETSGAPAIMPPSHKDHTTGAPAHTSRNAYPLRYPLYLYFAGGRPGSLAQDFVEYCVARGMGKDVGHESGHQ